jgi:thiamine-phosphate pyrophosphorylase
MFDLYLITPAQSAALIASTLRRALQGAVAGRVAVQLRGKHLPDDDLHRLARELRAQTRDAGVPLFINTRADVALACGADGVHLPENRPLIVTVRALPGANLAIGVSCHDRAGLVRAAREGANFATLAPVFHVPGKGEPLGIDGFSALAGAAGLPVYALGGVTATHIAQLHTAGAQGVALTREIFGAADPQRAVEACLAAFDHARERSP